MVIILGSKLVVGYHSMRVICLGKFRSRNPIASRELLAETLSSETDEQQKLAFTRSRIFIGPLGAYLCDRDSSRRPSFSPWRPLSVCTNILNDRVGDFKSSAIRPSVNCFQ